MGRVRQERWRTERYWDLGFNIAVAVGYGSSAHAEQTNNVSIDQSAVQIAGVGGNGGNGNAASGGNVGSSSSGTDVIAAGGNGAGNGGDGAEAGVTHITAGNYGGNLGPHHFHLKEILA